MNSGEYVYINRLAKFFPEDSWQWNDGEIITLEDITNAINKNQSEESEPFGDQYKHFIHEDKSKEWHISRIIYFINHPNEIKDIELESLCSGGYMFPAPYIYDGNHRFMAAMWLHQQDKMDKVHCYYGGRLDVLDYLTGKIEECPDE